MSFCTEQEMSSRFRRILLSAIESEGVRCLPEVDGGVGIPDYLLVAMSGQAISYVVAIELKIRDWHRGLLQAFRYRNFTNEVYVVLDREHLQPALANSNHFQRAGVGLASFAEDGSFEVHILAVASKPFSELLSERVALRISHALSDLEWGPKLTAHQFFRGGSGRERLINVQEYLSADARK